MLGCLVRTSKLVQEYLVKYFCFLTRSPLARPEDSNPLTFYHAPYQSLGAALFFEGQGAPTTLCCGYAGFLRGLLRLLQSYSKATHLLTSSGVFLRPRVPYSKCPNVSETLQQFLSRLSSSGWPDSAPDGPATVSAMASLHAAPQCSGQ